jgi:hypothetical protein
VVEVLDQGRAVVRLDEVLDGPGQAVLAGQLDAVTITSRLMAGLSFSWRLGPSVWFSTKYWGLFIFPMSW